MIKELTQDNFDKEIKEGLVLVDFYANWCGPCRILKPVLEELAGDYKIMSVNIDNEEDLALKYNVSSIPCLILFRNGEEIKRSIGLQPKDDIEKMLEGKSDV